MTWLVLRCPSGEAKPADPGRSSPSFSSVPKFGTNHVVRRTGRGRKLETVCAQKRSIINQPAAFDSGAEPKEEIHEANQLAGRRASKAARPAPGIQQSAHCAWGPVARASRAIDLEATFSPENNRGKMGDHEVVISLPATLLPQAWRRGNEPGVQQFVSGQSSSMRGLALTHVISVSGCNFTNSGQEAPVPSPTTRTRRGGDSCPTESHSSDL